MAGVPQLRTQAKGTVINLGLTDTQQSLTDRGRPLEAANVSS